MEQIKIYEHPEFGKIRTVIIDGEPWFVGKDVAVILGYNQPHKAIAQHVDKDDGIKHTLTDTIGRPQEMTVINESGLYSLILSSKLPTAKKFKRWVTSKVLPSIRKTGSYTKMSPMEMIAELANNAVKAEKILDEHNKRIADLEQKADINFENVVHEALSYATLNFKQQEYINKVVGIKVMGLVVDRKVAYSDMKSCYRKLYADLYRRFNVNSYRNIRARDMETAADFIRNWQPKT